jgi:hypothetical protein
VNRLAIYTTNNFCPYVAAGDRRWSVFGARYPGGDPKSDVQRALEAAYRQFEGRLHDWPELRHFYDSLLKLKVDRALIHRPLENTAREEARTAVADSVDALMDALEADGLTAAVREVDPHAVYFQLDDKTLFSEHRRVVASVKLFELYQRRSKLHGFERLVPANLFSQRFDPERFPATKVRLEGKEVRVRIIKKW